MYYSNWMPSTFAKPTYKLMESNVSKLLQIKDWLTIPDAAKQLTSLLGENVTESDLLYFALNGKIRLSVFFVNPTRARLGKKILLSEADYDDISQPDDIEPQKLYQGTVLLHQDTPEHCVVEWDEEHTIFIEGLHDLTMLGSEQIDIEKRYHKLMGGPTLTQRKYEGIIVVNKLGKLFELVEGEVPHPDPVRSLPDDCILVVRTAVILDFVYSITHQLTNEVAESSVLTKPPGHLDHDPQMQLDANKIATDLIASSGRIPTRDKVAKILAKTLGMAEETVARRIRSEWKNNKSLPKFKK